MDGLELTASLRAREARTGRSTLILALTVSAWPAIPNASLPLVWTNTSANPFDAMFSRKLSPISANPFAVEINLSALDCES